MTLFRDVNYPGQSGRSFGVSVATLTEVDDDGTYTFSGLIPGATYNTHVEVSGYPQASSEHVRVAAGQSPRVKDFRLPAVDQEVGGIVVDLRGKPLTGITVSYERDGNNRALDAPEGPRLVSGD